MTGFLNRLALGAILFCIGFATAVVRAATFSGDASIQVVDSTAGLSWNNSASQPALTVACWFKLSIPSDFALTQDMAILVNRRSGSSTDVHAFAIYLSATTGNIEFSSRGTSSEPPQKLIDHPYLERWYHVAIVRSGSNLKAYVDGRETFNVTTNVGDSRSTDGVSVGGWGTAKYLRGEVQEVAIYQAAMSQDFITQYLFSDLPTDEPELNLRGYYKLAFAFNPADQLRNFAANPPAGTDPATKQGSGTIGFDETNKAGEQSTFDSRKKRRPGCDNPPLWRLLLASFRFESANRRCPVRI